MEQQRQLEANLEILEEEQLRIGTLVAARKQSENRAADALAAQEAEAEALAQKAGSIRQLIDELTRRAQAVAYVMLGLTVATLLGVLRQQLATTPATRSATGI